MRANFFQYILHELRIAHNGSNIIEIYQYKNVDIMIWDKDRRSTELVDLKKDLYLFPNSTISPSYLIWETFEILLEALFYLWMIYNARCHRLMCVENQLHNEGINWMDWPVHSADVNQIGNAWDGIGLCTAKSKTSQIRQKKQIISQNVEWIISPGKS